MFLLELGRRSIAFITGFALLCAQVAPVYGMQGGRSEEEQEQALPSSSNRRATINPYIQPQATSYTIAVSSFSQEGENKPLGCTLNLGSSQGAASSQEGQVDHFPSGHHSVDKGKEKQDGVPATNRPFFLVRIPEIVNINSGVYEHGGEEGLHSKRVK